MAGSTTGKRRLSGRPSLRFERSLLRDGVTYLACADEVGRGALSGPATVGMVVIAAETKTAPQGVRDSKLLTPEARERLAPKVRRWALAHSVGHASPDEIEDYVADETARAAAALREFGQASRFNRVHTLPYRLRRSIEQDVLDAARERNAQLVVVGAGRKRFLESVILGSVAEGILRDAECDVLVIPDGAVQE